MNLQIDPDFISNWETIVHGVSQKEFVPLDCIAKVVFRSHDKKQKTINLKRLADQGLEIDEIQEVLDRYIQEHSLEIKACEFVIDIKAVAELLQPETDQYLKGLK